jgi:hypothetical protein
MLSDVLTLNDGTADHDYTLVSQNGMSSIRRDMAEDMDLNASVVISNDIDFNSPSKLNRSLVKLTFGEEDATTGDIYTGSVHAVITRHKKFSADSIHLMCAQLADFLTTTADVDQVLNGGN